MPATADRPAPAAPAYWLEGQPPRRPWLWEHPSATRLWRLNLRSPQLCRCFAFWSLLPRKIKGCSQPGENPPYFSRAIIAVRHDRASTHRCPSVFSPQRVQAATYGLKSLFILNKKLGMTQLMTVLKDSAGRADRASRMRENGGNPTPPLPGEKTAPAGQDREASAANGFSAFNRADQRCRPSSRRTTARSVTQFSCNARRGPR
jgi:hypothetical protein